jgi:predicted enzyme involved in methoxymalonyl-ACP biosynthesis
MHLEEKNLFRIVISATFTAEPIKDYLDWWSKKFDMGLEIDFTGYNQVFQELISSDSLLSKNSKGVNIILVRFEDWIRYDKSSVSVKINKIERNFHQLMELIQNIDSKKTIPHFLGIFPPSTHLSLEPQIIDLINRLYERQKRLLKDLKIYF